MSGDSIPPLFDAHASQYDLDLSRGLDLTGEGKEYYVQGRIGRLAALLARCRERPRRILDYGCGTGGAMAALQESFRPECLCGADLSEASLGRARDAHPTAVFT